MDSLHKPFLLKSVLVTL